VREGCTVVDAREKSHNFNLESELTGVAENGGGDVPAQARVFKYPVMMPSSAIMQAWEM